MIVPQRKLKRLFMGIIESDDGKFRLETNASEEEVLEIMFWLDIQSDLNELFKELESRKISEEKFLADCAQIGKIIAENGK